MDLNPSFPQNALVKPEVFEPPKIRKGVMPDKNSMDTDEFPQPSLQDTWPQMNFTPVAVDVFGLSDQGKVRDNNEDTFLIARFDRTMRALQSNLPPDEYPADYDETSYGMLVADGMGGHAAGEVASRTAVLVILDLVLKTPDWIMRLNDQVLGEVMRRAEQRLQAIQGTLAEKARADAALSGMGTTLTMAWNLGADLVVAHVGDSRAYLMRDGQLQQLTRDQTLVQTLVEAGTLTAEEARRHRLRHIVTGILSTDECKMAFEFHHLRLLDGDQVLLCSDGLTEMLPDTALAEILRRPGSAQETCCALRDLALDAGGRDNITVVLARYSFPKP